MTVYGIDVSEWQGSINWSEVSTGFCIIRAGYGKYASQKDKCFESNYSGCKANNISCGAYWYSYAMTAEEAVLEAQICISILSGKQFEYPIYYDVEQAGQFALGKAAVSDIIRAFLDTLEAAGYWAGIYMSSYYLNSYVDDDIKSRYAVWVAHHGVSFPNYSNQYGMWQKSSTGSVSGISENVDIDECYVNYPAEMKAAGLNGFSKNPRTIEIAVTVNGITYAGELEEI